MYGKQTIELNLPDGWKVEWKESRYVNTDDNGDCCGETEVEEYEINPAENRFFSRILLEKFHCGFAYPVKDDVIGEAQRYLDLLNLPAVLKPDAHNYVKSFELENEVGSKVLYFIDQKPGESNAVIIAAYEALDEDHVWIHGFLKDWNGGAGEKEGIEFLSKMIISD